MQASNRPIGVFDSGLGGLTVVKEILKQLPNEDIIYLGDTARVPYGTRSKETVIKFSFEDAKFLLDKNVKCIVIACNTSSALAGNELKKKLKIPVFDVIGPALKEARKVTKNGRIGVIGTRGTIGSGAYKVPFSQACPLFVPFIEEGEIDGNAICLVAKKYLSSLKNKNIDTLIMGCTHYPLIKNIIENEVDHHKVGIIDPGKTVAQSLSSYLLKNKLSNDGKRERVTKYFVTDITARFREVAEMFLGNRLGKNLKKIDL